jgi:outer membrane receptor protein involved in Fe transport
MFQRATRAPNVNELFAPLVSGLANLAVDPCGGTAINAGQANSAGTLSNLCRLTGVPTAFIGSLPNPSAGQINVRSGGNPAIGPEEADTTTVGFVWTPAAINGLQVTFDYYQIDLEKAVSSPSAQDILNDCYLASRNPGLTFNSACALVLRSPFTGTFNGVDSPGVVTPISNLGKFEVKGYDLGANYSFPLENLGMDSKWGTLSIGLSANFADTWKFQATPNSLNRNCLGYYSTSCGQPLPETTWNQRTTWSFGAFDFSYNWRHIGKVVEEPAPGNPANFLPAYAKIDAYNYFDLTAAWQVNDMLRATLTIANATDEQPPEVGNTIGTTSTNSGNTYPQSYDVIGRYYTLGVSVKF